MLVAKREAEVVQSCVQSMQLAAGPVLEAVSVLQAHFAVMLARLVLEAGESWKKCGAATLACWSGRCEL